MNAHLIIDHVTKSYGAGSLAVDDISFEVKQGEFVVIIGSSGAGKSTLLRCLNRMVEPTDGSVIFEGHDITHFKGKQIREARRRIGMIFQHFNLASRLTVMQNVMHGRLGYMSTLESVLNQYKEEDKQKAVAYLEKVGLLEHMYKRASELSGGQKQRVGIVRALMQEPSLLLCDEPIASLDPNSSKVIMDLIRDLTREQNISCIVNLHQVHVAKQYATRIIGIRKGKLVFDGPPSKLGDNTIEEIYNTSIDKLMMSEEVQAVV
ncbi:phosphonate ABC transporter ATP-binding protein [Paenibacillus sp. GP183]|uniref:phosphonate ABC transporter ATP-binding protein n=1 Tax=Paenibacillus sp. GP183 TaxID=1882751 RepID=UPI0008951825|nr:phosphonate ABC transporter ATP-binding protein [Paenibacillus sp. GP183]SEC62110.1 phosphonate transport system ATP-binding protein [Paenibacillus sp. GP183]